MEDTAPQFLNIITCKLHHQYTVFTAIVTADKILNFNVNLTILLK